MILERLSAFLALAAPSQPAPAVIARVVGKVRAAGGEVQRRVAKLTHFHWYVSTVHAIKTAQWYSVTYDRHVANST